MYRDSLSTLSRFCVAAVLVSTLAAGALSLAPAADAPESPWPRHAVDDSSSGADGVRLADLNADGLPDITTGWEEGGRTCIYLNPGPAKARKKWPTATIGKTPAVEDAVFADLDGRGTLDVVSCCEGGEKTVYVHWGPADPKDCLEQEKWTQAALPASRDRMRWMFAMPVQVDGENGMDLVAAGKGGNAQIGWFEAPENPRRLADWQWHPISKAGWIMSLRSADMDGDGDRDILTSDRKGDMRGVRWLENPGPGAAQTKPWKNHYVGGRNAEVMFLDIGDLDDDDRPDIACAAKGSPILLFLARSDQATGWEKATVPMPPNTGTGKGVAIEDIDGDGKPDLALTCEHANGSRRGAMWLSYGSSPVSGQWTARDISGPTGVKYDRIEMLDLDADGDPDLLTCEEQARGGRGLGVIWYENPTARE